MKHFFFIFLATFFLASCGKDNKPGSLEVRFIARYKGESLVMFDEYQYPDGRPMQFSRFSFYIDDLSLQDTILVDLDYYDLTNSHVDLAKAQKGYVVTFDNIPSGDYSGLSFGIGVPPDQNAMQPADFPASHLLSSSAEYWHAWQSYIFAKVEGKLDSDNNGTKDMNMALHLGADEAYQKISGQTPIKIKSGKTTIVEVVFDLYDFLGGDQNTYDIDSNPQIHSKSQNDQVFQLSNNLKQCVDISVK